MSSRARLVLFRYKDDQSHRTRRDPLWNAGLQSMLFIDVADQFDAFMGDVSIEMCSTTS
jgi:hypothetical protein